MNIVIIGNGPSRKLFKKENYSDSLIVGCNFSDASHNVDYAIFVDAFAAKFMRKGELHQDYLFNHKIILGERAATGLTSFKSEPASHDSLFKYLLDSGKIESIVIYPERFREMQQFFSAGHMAFYWASDKYNKSTFHMYGFDSIFTGDHRSSFSNVLREWPIDHKIRQSFMHNENQSNAGVSWISWWKDLFFSQNYESVTIYGLPNEFNVFHDFGPKVVQRIIE